MKKAKGSGIWFIPVVLSLLLAIGTATVFSACGMKEDGSWMKCHQPQVIITWCAFGMTVLLLAAALLKSIALKGLLSALCVIACGVLFFLPGAILPMCMMRTMRCYTVMQPFARVLSVLIAILVCVSLAGEIKRKPRPRAEGSRS